MRYFSIILQFVWAVNFTFAANQENEKIKEKFVPYPIENKDLNLIRVTKTKEVLQNFDCSLGTSTYSRLLSEEDLNESGSLLVERSLDPKGNSFVAISVKFNCYHPELSREYKSCLNNESMPVQMAVHFDIHKGHKLPMLGWSEKKISNSSLFLKELDGLVHYWNSADHDTPSDWMDSIGAFSPLRCKKKEE